MSSQLHTCLPTFQVTLPGINQSMTAPQKDTHLTSRIYAMRLHQVRYVHAGNAPTTCLPTYLPHRRQSHLTEKSIIKCFSGRYKKDLPCSHQNWPHPSGGDW